MEPLTLFGLKKNHIKLINFFLAKTGKEFSAREISSEVKIPISRIYPYLNDLVNDRLLERNIGSKTVFVMTDPQIRFREFLNRKEHEIKEVEKIILSKIASYGQQSFVAIKSSEEYYQTVYLMLRNTKNIKILSHTPFFIFTSENLRFWEEQLLNTYKSGIENGDLEFYCIIDKNFFKDRIVKRNKHIVNKNIKWLEKHKNVHIKTIDASKIVSMVITDGEVLIGFSDPRERKVARGLLLRSYELMKFFENTYNKLFNEAEDVIGVSKKALLMQKVLKLRRR